MEDMKTYVLSNLSMCGADEIFCSICRLRMPVYDQFPLVNGLMFLSPDLNSEEHPVYVSAIMEDSLDFIFSRLKSTDKTNTSTAFASSAWKAMMSSVVIADQLGKLLKIC